MIKNLARATAFFLPALIPAQAFAVGQAGPQTFTATINGFNAAVIGTPLAVTTTSATSTSFTSSTQIAVFNVGSTGAYCLPGATATTSDPFISPGGWFGFYASGGITQVSCLTASGTTTVNIAAGSGIVTGGVSPTGILGFAAGATFSGSNGVMVGGLNGSAWQAFPLDPSTSMLEVASYSGPVITNPTSTMTLPTRTPASSANAVTAASPCVFTWTATPAVNGQTVVLSGTTPPGTAQFVFGTPYYVVAKATNSIELAATLGGTAINCTTTAGVGVVSTLTYEPGDIIADNATAGSIGSHSFAIATSGGGAIIPYVQLQTNATSLWNGVQVSVNLWRAAATYTNGDDSTYAPATGSASYIGTYTGTLIQMGDGAVGNLYPTSNVATMPKLASGTSVFWDVQLANVPAVPISAQTFTLTAFPLN